MAKQQGFAKQQSSGPYRTKGEVKEEVKELTEEQRLLRSLLIATCLLGVLFMSTAVAHGVCWEYGVRVLGDTFQGVAIVFGVLHSLMLLAWTFMRIVTTGRRIDEKKRDW